MQRIALTSLHWSLVCTSLFTAAVMIVFPNLFQRKMEVLGEDCAREQASAVGSLKDLLSGFDVLRFFGQSSRFLQGVEASSEQMEKPRYRQTVIQTNIKNGLDVFAFLLQEMNLVLIGYLSIKGIIIQAALSGGGNLCGSVYNGLKQIAAVRLSFSGSKPYFDRLLFMHRHNGKQKKKRSDWNRFAKRFLRPVFLLNMIRNLFWKMFLSALSEEVNMHLQVHPDVENPPF